MSEIRGESGRSQAPVSTKEGARDERPRLRDWRNVLGANRDDAGTSPYTGKVFAAGLAAIAITVGIINTLDVIATHRMRPEFGILPPIVWESTAGVAILVAALIPWALLKYAPVERKPLWRTALLYTVCAPLFSVVHIATFIPMRMFAYWMAGSHYHFGPLIPGFEYETSRNVFAYFGSFCAFWFAARFLGQPQPLPAVGARLFQIRDGARLIRVPIHDILAVASAGNYVEFVLRDGRRPMMRKPISALEVELSVDGFVRTHRSWLVNAMQVTGLKPAGSGDYEVEIGSVNVPLSRRFPEALAKLRAG